MGNGEWGMLKNQKTFTTKDESIIFRSFLIPMPNAYSLLMSLKNADGETRTRKSIAHTPLKRARIPIPPHPHDCLSKNGL